MRRGAVFAVLAVALCAGGARADRAEDVWGSYLDYAYVFSAAEPRALAQRLDGYGAEAGASLRDFVVEHFEARPDGPDDEDDDVAVRRRAVAYLLDYLARSEPASLERSVEAIRSLEDRLGRHENRYWYHYILAHRSLERGQRHDFVAQVLDLWLHVVVPLETPYESLQTLSLSDSPHSGFVAALPYVYENVARLILLRSQQLGLARGLDPLAAIVRLLADGRVGAHPDVIPLAASSKDYLDRIVARLDGPESDAGSLTFTLALFEATKHHERARGLLASEGFSPATIEAIRLASGAYRTALDRADTEQGRCAVQTRVLRQIGEVFAAKQRLGEDPEIESPFSIEAAIEVYGTMQRGLPDGWAKLGYARNGRKAFVDAMHLLWEEIQETTLNTADYYLAQAVESPHLADEHSRNAARLYARYLSFFLQFATEAGREAVPDSAYFASHEAARGIGDAYLAYATRPTQGEVELATRRYRSALELFPFDRALWPALTDALERQGRETEYLEIVRPVAEWVTRSRSVAGWIDKSEPGAAQIAVLKRALSDTQVIMYLGFGNEAEVPELERGIGELRERRNAAKQRLRALQRRRGDTQAAVPASADENAPVASGDRTSDPLERAEMAREMVELGTLLELLDKQIEARERALPLYKETLRTEGLIPALRAQRDHPVHTLLRRMFYERRS